MQCNLYYIRDFSKVPDYIRRQPTTLCLRRTGYRPTHEVIDISVNAFDVDCWLNTICIADPTQEDLTLLALLGVECETVISPYHIRLFTEYLSARGISVD